MDTILALAFALFLVSIYLIISLIPRRAEVSLSGGGEARLVAELADTGPKKALGMMFRGGMAPGTGMLFTFAREGRQGFWMLFTHIPLEALFFSADGALVDVLRLEPNSTLVRRPAKPALHVLEVPAGFCGANGMVIGKTTIRVGKRV